MRQPFRIPYAGKEAREQRQYVPPSVSVTVIKDYMRAGLGTAEIAWRLKTTEAAIWNELCADDRERWNRRLVTV